MNATDPLFVEPAGGLLALTIQRAGGREETLDPAKACLQLRDEHPDLDQMQADWGAVCAAFERSAHTYLVIPGVALFPGDVVRAQYAGAQEIRLRVLALEGWRVLVAWD